MQCSESVVKQAGLLHTHSPVHGQQVGIAFLFKTVYLLENLPPALPPTPYFMCFSFFFFPSFFQLSTYLFVILIISFFMPDGPVWKHFS